MDFFRIDLLIKALFFAGLAVGALVIGVAWLIFG